MEALLSRSTLVGCVTWTWLLFSATASEMKPAANAINAFGIKLCQIAVNDAPGNICISPYSIQAALAMTYAGADGETLHEMARVLDFPGDPLTVAALFQSLNASLQKSAADPSNKISLDVANRLFGRTGFAFRSAFLNLLKEKFQAPLEELNFGKNPSAAAARINAWVAERTRNRICDLIPAGALNETTTLVLVNALYLKAPWAEEFHEGATQSRPFFISDRKKHDVLTMSRTDYFGYKKDGGFTLVSVPLRGRDFQFLILLPDEANRSPKFLTPDLLAACAQLPSRDVCLFLPKFKLELPTMSLSRKLQSMGLKSAFDMPKGSANFDRMAPRKPDEYLYISDVFHKTFIAVDEKGIEAAAATAILMPAQAIMQKHEPIEVHIDRPFYFAIQHVPSGSCLFLGHVKDPR